MSGGGEIAEVAERLKSARRVVVITGAGISAESGLRTFRGGEKDMDSLWKEFDPQTLATPEAFEANPELVTRWYDWRRMGCLAAEPNPGHLALAEIERRMDGADGGVIGEGGGVAAGPRSFTLLTQNVDRLHQKAGSRNVVELHGSIIQWRCVDCGARVVPGTGALPAFPARAACCAGRDGRGALLRPDVVWFGEALPFEAMRAADEAAAACDLFFSIGTSAVVYPAAGYIHAAARAGAGTVEINRDPTPISGVVDWSIQGKAGEILPRIVEMAFG